MTSTPQVPDHAALLVRLDECRQDQLASLGGKGANLIRMRDIGISIPSGFCLTTECYRQFVIESEIQSGIADVLGELGSLAPDALNEASTQIRAMFDTATVPMAVAACIKTEFEKLGSSVVARSSANAEDLAGASFAGLHDSFLNIKNYPELLRAVIKCWSSLWTGRSIAYRAKNGIPNHSVAMGVVIHEFLPASASGVIFTQNPVTGNKNQMLVNATIGIGEALVGGVATPDEILIDKKSGKVLHQTLAAKVEQILANADGGTRTEVVADPQSNRLSITDSEVSMLAQIGRTIEDGFGCPMDIEWVSYQGKVRVVQARPITTDNTSSSKTEEWLQSFKVRLNGMLLEYFPAPMYPFDRSALLSLVEATLNRLGDSGLNLPAAAETIIQHPTGEIGLVIKLPRIGWLSVPRFMRFACRLLFQRGESPSRFVECYLPKLESALPKLTVDLSQLSSHDIAKRYHEALRLRDSVFAARANYFWSGWGAIALLQGWLMLCYGKSWSSVYFSLTSSLDLPTTQIRKEMVALASAIRGNPACAQLIGEGLSPAQVMQNGRDELAGVRATFAEFISKYGSRTLDLIPMPTSRSWKDDPALVTGFLFTTLDTEKNGVVEPPQPRKLIPRRLVDAFTSKILPTVRAMTVERDNVIRAYEEATVPLRRIMLELGRRLTENRLLVREMDVRFLEAGEGLRGLDEGGEVWRSEIRQRIVVRKFARPTTIHNWRRPRRTLTVGRVAGTELLRGLAASPGVVKGRAAIIMGEGDFGKLEDGDILVCVASNPAWTTLFGKASAVVADLGGPLSHAAIVAREFGIPAVLNTQTATQELQHGTWYVVDGTGGVVCRDDPNRV